MAVLTSFAPLRIQKRTLIAIGMAALAAALVLTVTRPTASVDVLVAGEDLPAGAVLEPGSVMVRSMSSAEGLLAGSSLGELAGWSVAIDVAEGEPLLASLLVDPDAASQPSSLSISIPQTHAALGSIIAGDRVDIYVTWPATPGEARRTELLAAGVEVIDSRASEVALGGVPQLELLFAVDAELAPLIAGGHRIGELDLVRAGR